MALGARGINARMVDSPDRASDLGRRERPQVRSLIRDMLALQGSPQAREYRERQAFEARSKTSCATLARMGAVEREKKRARFPYRSTNTSAKVGCPPARPCCCAVP